MNMLRNGITARDVMTKKAFENAITVAMVLGGSTNAVLHLLAIAREAEVDLTLDDFTGIGDKIFAINFMRCGNFFWISKFAEWQQVLITTSCFLDAKMSS